MRHPSRSESPVVAALISAFTVLSLPVHILAAADSSPDVYNVVWSSPSTSSSGSMPLGNGEVCVNAWVQENGDLQLYLSRTDTWSEHARLLKLGRVRIRMQPDPFAAGLPFRQELKLRTGEVEIIAGAADKAVTLRLWVDAHRPVVHIDLSGQEDFQVEAALDMWRTERRTLARIDGFNGEACGVDGLTQDSLPTEGPDTVAPDTGDRVVWYHRNEHSLWPVTLKLQGLETLPAKIGLVDPLLNRTFGGALIADGLTRAAPLSLKSREPRRRWAISVHTHTAVTDSPAAWLDQLTETVTRNQADTPDQALGAHRDWWERFWGRSWIHVSDAKRPDSTETPAFQVSRAYALQRYVNACGGRGRYPIKFNGSIFTVDAKEPHGEYNADYRRWGGAYWWQNTRFPYWAMLAAGDDDLMEPLFRMYRDLLPFAEARTRVYYGHDGAFFPETQYFWGTYWNGKALGYGWDREKLPLGMTENQYIRYYWQGGLEICAIMLDRWALTRDEAFARSTLIPVAHSVVTFYDQHWKRDASGKIRFEPSQSLETWWSCVNPAPEIAGLQRVLGGLLSLPTGIGSEAQRRQWQKTLADLPELPRKTENGATFLLPAASFANKQNQENPELYAVFPYALFGTGRPELPVALETWKRRLHKGTGCWQQDPIHAAYLGLADEAAELVAKNASPQAHGNSRFPAFWDDHYDWVPDQCHGGVTMTALQAMAMQWDGERILLLPAWPKAWNVRFRLRAPGNTTVEAEYRDGQVHTVRTEPAARAAHIVR